MGGGFRQNKPSSISLLTHSHKHTSKYCNITGTSIMHKTHIHITMHRQPSTPPSPSARETQQGMRLVGWGGRGCSVLVSTGARHSNDSLLDQPFWYVCMLHLTTKPAKPGHPSSFLPAFTSPSLTPYAPFFFLPRAGKKRLSVTNSLRSGNFPGCPHVGVRMESVND